MVITISGIVGIAVVSSVTAYGITKTCQKKQNHPGSSDSKKMNTLEKGTTLRIPKKDERKLESQQNQEQENDEKQNLREKIESIYEEATAETSGGENDNDPVTAQ